MFQKHICPPWCKIQNDYLYVQGMGATPAPRSVLIKWRGYKILSWQHTGLERVVWTWPLNMWPENQWRSSTYWAKHLHQVWFWSSEGVKDIERTTHLSRKSGLTLTFEHVTWKSIGIIYSLRITPDVRYWSGEGFKRYWADNTWSTDRQTDRPTDRQLQNNMPPFSRGA